MKDVATGLIIGGLVIIACLFTLNYIQVIEHKQKLEVINILKESGCLDQGTDNNLYRCRNVSVNYF